MTWNTSFQPLLACKISLDKSADSLMHTLLYVSLSFSLAALKILSLSLILGDVIMIGFGCASLGPNFLGLCASWTSWKSISFARLGSSP